MKCVCPMGGDRTCPDNCLLASWYALPIDQRTKEQRRPRVEQLAKQGFTQEAIAMQLQINQATVSRDFEKLCIVHKLKHAKSASNPKGAGRPTGSKSRGGPKPERRQTNLAIEQKAAALVLDQGKTYEEVRDQLGLKSVQPVKTAVAREEGRREPVIDRSELSMTAQAKLDAAIRQHIAKIDAQRHTLILEEARKRIDEIILPHWKEKIDQAQQLFARRRGLMQKETFNTIRRALHPDSRHSISDKKLAEAFDAFMALEKYLLNEKDSPTEFPDLPQTWQDWEAAKRKATAERKARHTANRSALRVR